MPDSPATEQPAPDDHREITITRLDTGVYQATNPRGGTLVFGSRAGDAFTPVELLLAALGGCSAVDIDVVTARRVEPVSFDVTVSAEVDHADGANRLTDIGIRFQLDFGQGPEADSARRVAPAAARVSHQRTCTVSRTVELGTPVAMTVEFPAGR